MQCIPSTPLAVARPYWDRYYFVFSEYCLYCYDCGGVYCIVLLWWSPCAGVEGCPIFGIVAFEFRQQEVRDDGVSCALYGQLRCVVRATNVVAFANIRAC